MPFRLAVFEVNGGEPDPTPVPAYSEGLKVFIIWYISFKGLQNLKAQPKFWQAACLRKRSDAAESDLSLRLGWWNFFAGLFLTIMQEQQLVSTCLSKSVRVMYLGSYRGNTKELALLNILEIPESYPHT
jgi:hypothetical protein